MPIARFEMPDGRVARFEVPEGTTPEQAQGMMQAHFQESAAPQQERPERFGERVNRELASAPRQIGLTARHGIEGLSDVAGIFTEPVRAGLNAAGMNIPKLNIPDMLGLPSPETPTERVVGEASRFVAGSGGMVGAAGKAAPLVRGMAKPVLSAIASNPGMQLSSAAGAGLAGGITRETGGNNLAQILASLAGGVVAPLGVTGLQKAGRAAMSLIPKTDLDVNIKINDALRRSGITLDALPAGVRQSIREDVRKSLNVGGDLSTDAVRRLADYRRVGATPTAAGITLDPVTVTQQRNLAKIGANTRDPVAQQLSRVQNENTNTLITALNDLGAGSSGDAVATGGKVIGSLGNRAGQIKGAINSLYDAARATDGRSASLDPAAFTTTANNLLDESLLGGKLSGDVRGHLNSIAVGKTPLTVDVAEQLKTRIGELQRASADKAERMALGLVRKALDDTPLLDGQGQQAIDAFNKARRANRLWMQTVEKTPALQAVLEGVEPDKFVQKFIIGSGEKSNIMDVHMLKRAIKNDTATVQAIKGNILQYLKAKATNGAPDEAANFSSSAFGKALNAIGERKLGLFFSREELDQLNAVARVARYEQFQPSGSAVNNSNTAGSVVATALDRIGGSSLLGKIPLGPALIGDPARNIAISMRSKGMLDIPQAITSKAMPRPFPAPWSPMLLYPGLLSE